METNNRGSSNFGPQHYEPDDGGARRTGHPLAQYSTVRQPQGVDTGLVQHAESNYTKPFRGLPAEIRLMIWRFAIQDPLRASIVSYPKAIVFAERVRLTEPQARLWK